MADVRFWTATAGTDWEHGLPCGNGSMGALLYGNAGRHEITVAHERVVLPTDEPRRAPILAPDLPLIREFIDTGRAQEAAVLGVARAREQGYPGLQWTDPLVPSVTIVIETDDREVSQYRRTVDLAGDVVSVSWNSGDQKRSIDLFVSRADAVVVARLRGFTSSLRVRSEPPRNVVTSASGVKGGNAERVSFDYSEQNGLERLGMRFRTEWTSILAGSDATVLTQAKDDELVILADVRPVFASESSLAPHPSSAVEVTHDFAGLLARHEAAIAREINVVTLDLAAQSDSRSTEDLLADGSSMARNRLLELQHRSAQRLIASSTGEYPPTLQGVWSGTFDPAWSSDYTMNGNVQSGSISSMLSSGNPKQLRTFLDLLEGLTDDFRANAERLFGTQGYVLPSRCSPTHGACTHFDEQHCHEFWTAGGAWASMFFFDFVWHTGDVEYLRAHAYPFAREVERFYEGFLLRDAGGRITFSPSYSPENRSPTFDSQACRNATMDRAVLAGLLDGLRRAALLLGIDEDLDQRRGDWLASLPPYRVAPDGTLAEWLDEGAIEQVGHRTSSHLLGTWFEPDRDLVTTHREPIRRLIEEKLRWRSSGGHREEMAYGLTQLGIAAAAIAEPELALECVDRMSQLYFLPTLSTTHDVGAIFNVDIAGGLPAVVHSMLVGSTIDTLTVFPALPERWSHGSLRGLHARGGIIVDTLEWSPTSIRLQGRTTLGSRVLRGQQILAVDLPRGWTVLSGTIRGPESEAPNRWVGEIADGSAFTVEASR
ncbi:glycoside hydrolase N-terminal domain-containing protein [Glaciihabitans sp. UYNi722]|uniref:glycosyl hydrolase family 95 catalytic domain-containing protein n=1 Tax=Glaciihabitans sp. UYNi722 TaxID=3156344 RepID=UPI00339282BD